ncbi:hypothetical protein ACMSEJ_00135 [Bacteroides thetaiotaomicron]|uniref:hypothetical protein n=1 Tax=Bacteroides thetaiotaomicron TaxID=818 RepID=UPI0039C2CDCB
MSDDNDGIEIDGDDIGGEIVNQMVLNKVQDLMKKIFERLAARFGVKKKYSRYNYCNFDTSIICCNTYA